MRRMPADHASATATRKPHAEVANDHRRPRRLLSKLLRARLTCPLCGSRSLHVVKFRPRSTRIGCDLCGLRLTVNVDDVIAALHAQADTLTDDAADKLRRQADQLHDQANYAAAITRRSLLGVVTPPGRAT